MEATDVGARTPAVALLAAFATDVNRVQTLDEMFARLTDTALEVLAADSAHVGRFDLPHGQLRVLRNAGLLAPWEEEAPLDEVYQVGESEQLRVTVEEQRPCHTSLDDGAATAQDQELLTKLGKTHGMSVPLTAVGAVWGELYCTRVRDEPFTGHDEALARLLAAAVETGLVRIQGDQRLRELAYVDPLTGLANRRAVDEQLETWSNSAEHAPYLTVVLCDVNGLKQVNDTYGHLAGDRLLRETAGHVSVAAGRLPQGLAARIGGDEFLIVSLCEDQDLVGDVVADLSTDGLTHGLGLSCGSACAADLLRTDTTPEMKVRSLLRLADSEQYRRKRAGRGAILSPLAALDARPEQVRWGVDASHDVRALVEWLGGQARSVGVEERLSRVAHVLCGLAGAAAWWLSAADLEAGVLRARTCDSTRNPEQTDGEWSPVTLDTTQYRLADFPASDAVVRAGGVFYVDEFCGDAREQQIIVETGFRSLLASGGVEPGPAAGRRGWLLELYGDSLTTDLRRWADLLNAMTALALRELPAPQV